MDGRIVKITVSMDTTVNLGNYENVKMGGIIESSVGENDDIGALYSGLCSVLKAGIIGELAKMKSGKTDAFIAQIEDEDSDMVADGEISF